MSGQEINTWLDFCYEGDTDEYDEELELKDDFMFGVVMRNPKYCKPFLETIFGIITKA